MTPMSTRIPVLTTPSRIAEKTSFTGKEAKYGVTVRTHSRFNPNNTSTTTRDFSCAQVKMEMWSFHFTNANKHMKYIRLEPKLAKAEPFIPYMGINHKFIRMANVVNKTVSGSDI